MTADQLLEILTQVVYVVIFLAVGIQALRHPRPATIDIALFFGAAALTIGVTWVTTALHLPGVPWLQALSGSLVLALPYLLLRLVDDFATVPPLLMRATAAGLGLSVISLFVIDAAARPLWLTLLYVAYFVGLEIYAAVRFVQAARQTSGVTRRRMQAVAVGSLCLGLAIVMAGLQAGLPAFTDLWTALFDLFALGSGIGYFFGFAPPRWLRQAWREPALQAFLKQAAQLPWQRDVAAVARALAESAAATVGSPRAAVGLWDEAAQLLRYYTPGSSTTFDVKLGATIGGQAFATQQARFSGQADRDDPEHAALYQANEATAVMAAPITAGTKRLGVLAVFAARAPIFVEETLAFVRLLADQAAVVLESRALIEEVTRVQAREEATRLKDDFLSAAAHDLRTPLASLLLQAQLLERRLARIPAAAEELPRVKAHLEELQRLRTFVLELLDVARAEQGHLVGQREAVDLAALVRACCQRQTELTDRCRLDLEEALIGEWDAARLEQVVTNLLENAGKYSPPQSPIEVRAWRADGLAHLTVRDQGIGIPPDDLPYLFTRFHRGRNVDDRRFAGLGLGLYLCKMIVEGHDGRIWVESPGLGQGSTMHLALPLAPTAGSLEAAPRAGEDEPRVIER